MRALLCAVALSLVALPMATHGCAGLAEHAEWQRIDRQFGAYQGCFLMTDVDNGRSWEVGSRCDEALPPASSFKPLHTLIGLQTGAVAPDAVFTYDGRRQPFRAWERDHDLRSALRHSVVWAYQRLALAIGAPRMDEWLGRLDYGHGRRGPLTRFWLDGSWTVTARDQLDAMVRLVSGELPFDRRHIDRVRRWLRDPWPGHGRLGGKTGTVMIDGQLRAGWYVGYLEQGRDRLAFVTLLRAEDDARGYKARAITRSILTELGY